MIDQEKETVDLQRTVVPRAMSMQLGISFHQGVYLVRPKLYEIANLQDLSRTMQSVRRKCFNAMQCNYHCRKGGIKSVGQRVVW